MYNFQIRSGKPFFCGWWSYYNVALILNFCVLSMASKFNTTITNCSGTVVVGDNSSLSVSHGKIYTIE